MSSSGTIEQRLQEIIGLKLGVEPSEVPVDRPLLELGLDSLDVIRAVTEIEEAFPPVRIPLDVEGLTALHEVAVYIDRELSAS